MRIEEIALRDRALLHRWQWLRTHFGLGVVLVAFVAVAAQYALATPFFEMPGELWHLRRIQALSGNPLPDGLAFLGEAPPVPQADHEPPLYFWLGSLLVAPLELAAETAVYRLNPYAALGVPDDAANRNAVIVISPPRADGPLTTAILLLRFFSIVCSAGTCVLAYMAFLRLTRQRVVVSSVATAAMALLPGFLMLSASISNLPAGLLLLTASGYMAIRLADEPHPSPRLRWVSALIASLAALVSWWGCAAVVLVGLTLVAVARRSLGGAAVRVVALAPQLTLMAGAALGWLVWRLRTGSAAESLVVWDRLLEMGVSARALVAARAYWGLFGWLNVPADLTYYSTAAVLVALGLSGLALRAVQARWTRPGASRRGWIAQHRERISVTGIWIALGIALFVISVLSPSSTFLGAALLPLAPGFSLALTLGLEAWLRRRYAFFLVALLTLTFATMSVTAPLVYIAPAFAGPPILDLGSLPYDLRPMDVAFGPDLFLLGYRMDDSRMEPGGALALELFWLARRRMTADHMAHVTVLGRDGALVASHMGYVGGGARPSSLWIPGDVVVERIRLGVATDADSPTAADVRLSVYSDPSIEPLAGVDPHGNPLGGNVLVSRARLAAPLRIRYVPEQQMAANLDNQVSLVGYSLTPRLPRPGEDWRIVLYWRSEGPLIHDYTVFVHLVDSHGGLVAQADGPPLDGSYPTSFWAMGEHVRDTHTMPIPAMLPEGEYHLRLGLYRLETGERLTLVDSDPPIDFVAIGPINLP